jgi:hypothetical protein
MGITETPGRHLLRHIPNLRPRRHHSHRQMIARAIDLARLALVNKSIDTRHSVMSKRRQPRKLIKDFRASITLSPSVPFDLGVRAKHLPQHSTQQHHTTAVPNLQTPNVFKNLCAHLQKPTMRCVSTTSPPPTCSIHTQHV